MKIYCKPPIHAEDVAAIRNRYGVSLFGHKLRDCYFIVCKGRKKRVCNHVYSGNLIDYLNVDLGLRRLRVSEKVAVYVADFSKAIDGDVRSIGFELVYFYGKE